MPSAIVRSSTNGLTVGLDGVTMGQDGAGNLLIAATALRYKGFTGHNGAGAATLTGAKVGDIVVGVVKADGTDSAASFETTITIAGQIQQSSASDFSAVKFGVVLIARS